MRTEAMSDKPIFLVCTGEVHEGQETYTRHEGAPPPLCDFEGPLYAAPSVGAEPVAWQERQMQAPGVWGDWYACPFRRPNQPLEENCSGIPYQWRPLYAHPPAPVDRAALAALLDLREFCDKREGNNWRHVGGVIHRVIQALAAAPAPAAPDRAAEHLGVSVSAWGPVAVVIHQHHADGTQTVIHAGNYAKGDSVTRVNLAAAPAPADAGELAEDAARWRYVRSENARAPDGRWFAYPDPEKLDAAIDAARKKTNGS